MLYFIGHNFYFLQRSNYTEGPIHILAHAYLIDIPWQISI